MERLIYSVKFEFSDKAKDILESLELLNEAINSTIDNISTELNEALKSRDKIRMDKYNSLAIEGFKYEEMIKEIIKLLKIDNEVDKNGINTISPQV